MVCAPAYTQQPHSYVTALLTRGSRQDDYTFMWGPVLLLLHFLLSYNRPLLPSLSVGIVPGVSPEHNRALLS